MADELISEKFPEPKKEPATTPTGILSWEYWYGGFWQEEPSDYATNMRFRTTEAIVDTNIFMAPNELRQNLGLNSVGITAV